ncbi:MAG: hypothetical protein GEU81_03330 [Nitriliruptorales bacterium]|nr:hypothetical protein [Nitriliruptorales bacterium]
MTEVYPYELRLPLAPYRFVWAHEEPVECDRSRSAQFTEERYTHADGSVVIIRSYNRDGSFQILSDRGEVELDDHAADFNSPQAMSIVRLP